MLATDKLEILIVDDVKNNLLALRALLERDDISIHQALSGKEALELMMKHDFCLALLDVHMPEMNGFELAELMRGTKKTKNIPIIFVTAADKDQSHAFKGYETGAVDFLRKPLDPHAVKSKVNVFLELHQQKRELRKQVLALELTQKEQAKLLIELNKTKEELEQSVQLREDFMSIAGHELKTPLTSMKLQVQLRKRKLEKGLYSNIDADDLSQMFDADNKQLELLTLLIDDMLDISRISSGKFSMNPEYFDIGFLINEIAQNNMELFSKANIELKISSCEVIMGSWDKFRIEQVITNLLTNALRYGEGKPVKISITSEMGKAIIVIEDQGIGIAPEDVERIFQRFERVLGKEINGLGLGLYIVSQIIEAHGGTISVVSQQGVGSVFRIELPILERPIEINDIQKKLNGKKILVVDDSNENLNLFKLFMKEAKSEITFAQDGLEVIELCKENIYDIILMDIQMPKMNGVQATEALRGMKQTIPILAFTSFTSAIEHEKCMQAGFNDVLVKPISKNGLLRAIHHYLFL
jgi:signal transduction histidine kinase/BarA-like signal transduction histidine kinase